MKTLIFGQHYSKEHRVKPFLIVGAPRSGTGYIAKALEECGLPVGHERIFRPEGVQRNPHLAGEASWLGIPHLKRLNSGVLVFVQYRDPYKIIESMWHMDFWSRDNLFHIYAEKHSKLGECKRNIDKTIKFVLDWYDRVPRKKLALEWRVEDIDAELIDRVLGMAGYRMPRAKIMMALSKVGTDYNHKNHDKPLIKPVPWFKANPLLLTRLHSFAKAHGYEVRDVSGNKGDLGGAASGERGSPAVES